MRDTMITIQRPEGTTLVVNGMTAQHIAVQIDQVSLRQTIDLRNAYDYQAGDYFKVYTAGWYGTFLLRRDDVLIDELYRDPDTITAGNPTGNFFKYRVIGRVKDFQFDHQECFVRVVVGN